MMPQNLVSHTVRCLSLANYVCKIYRFSSIIQFLYHIVYYCAQTQNKMSIPSEDNNLYSIHNFKYFMHGKSLCTSLSLQSFPKSLYRSQLCIIHIFLPKNYLTKVGDYYTSKINVFLNFYKAILKHRFLYDEPWTHHFQLGLYKIFRNVLWTHQIKLL